MPKQSVEDLEHSLDDSEILELNFISERQSEREYSVSRNETQSIFTLNQSKSLDNSYFTESATSKT